MLRYMTLTFNYVVCSIEEAQHTKKLFIDELQSSLPVHKQNISSPEEEQALKLTYREFLIEIEVVVATKDAVKDAEGQILTNPLLSASIVIN